MKRAHGRRIRVLLAAFMICLVLSGLTAFALETELHVLTSVLGVDEARPPADYSGFHYWIARVSQGVRETNAQYPFMAYGTDWLAFGHIVIAVFFVGALVDPVRNAWVVTAGMVACVGVIPLALIAGAVRGIPFYWRLLDCGFGILGIVPLWLSRRYIHQLETLD